jgi:hypothetical protein
MIQVQIICLACSRPCTRDHPRCVYTCRLCLKEVTDEEVYYKMGGSFAETLCPN